MSIVSFKENVSQKDNKKPLKNVTKKDVHNTLKLDEQIFKYCTKVRQNLFDRSKLFDEDSLMWVAESFFNEAGILRHQIESYNNFIDVLAGKIITENSLLEIDGGTDRKIVLEMTNPFFDLPRYMENDNECKLLYPQEAKDRNATYASCLYIDIIKTEKVAQKIKEKKTDKTPERANKVDKIWSENKIIYKKQLLAKIPVMVGSKLCNLAKYRKDPQEMMARNEDPYDEGGYFIVNGGMKVVVSQERTSFNRIYTFEKNKKTSKFEVYSEVRSSATAGAHTTTTQCGMAKDGKLYAHLPYIPPTSSIPIGILFKALGVDKEEDVLEQILYSLNIDVDQNGEEIIHTTDDKIMTKKELSDKMKEIIVPNLEYTSGCRSEEQALFFIGKLGKKFVSAMELNNEEIIEKNMEEPSDNIFFRELANALVNKDEKSPTKTPKTEAIAFATNILRNELFPHLGTDYLIKRYYLGYMIYRFLCVKLKVKFPDDRDHYANKRADTVGILLHNLFYTAYKRYRTDCKIKCEMLLKKGNILLNPLAYLTSKTITKQLNNCLSTGNWCGYKNINTKKNGVSQVYEVFNYSSRLSNARKFSIPIGDNNTKIIPPRRLHNSQYYLMCPFETPEGKHTGLVKNISLTTYITIGYDQKDIIEIVKKLGFLPITRKILKKRYTKIFVNGIWLGFVKDSKIFLEKIRFMKLHNNINIETGIVYDDILDEVRISTDSGRLCRPLLVVKDNKLVIDNSVIKKLSLGQLSFTELCSTGVMELIDPDEAEFILLAERPCVLENSETCNKKYTHCMLDPSMMYGIGACQVPYANHNQSPRIVYHCAQCKQAVGIPNLNFDFVMDGSYHILHYPQKPLINTESSKLIKTDELPTGINANVVIAPYRGFNQEDSIIINKAFVQRGGFQTSHITHYSAEIKKDKKQALDIPDAETCIGFKGNSESIRYLSKTMIEDNDNNKNYYVNITHRSVGTKIYGYAGPCRQNKAGIRDDGTFCNLDKNNQLEDPNAEPLTFEKQKFNKQLNVDSQVPYGVIQVGSVVKHGDILIGITQEIEPEKDKDKSAPEIKRKQEKTKMNHSVIFDADDYGLVRKVQWGRNVNGYRYVKVKVISLKIPILGDKFSSRFGQNGQCQYKSIGRSEHPGNILKLRGLP